MAGVEQGLLIELLLVFAVGNTNCECFFFFKKQILTSLLEKTERQKKFKGLDCLEGSAVSEL
jgi:hypothetical protein